MYKIDLSHPDYFWQLHAVENPTPPPKAKRPFSFFKLLVILAALSALMFSRTAKADSTTAEHFTKHFVLSAGIYTGSYLFTHDVLGMDKTESLVFSAFTTLLIGFTYKAMEQMEQNTNVDFGKPMLYNGIGVVIPAVVLWHFDL